MPSPSYDPAEIAALKRESRAQDARDLASGRKSAEELKRENGVFDGARIKLDRKSLGFRG